MKQFMHAQSMVEYLLLIAVALVLIIAFLNPKKSVMKNQLNETFNAGVEWMDKAGDAVFK